MCCRDAIKYILLIPVAPVLKGKKHEAFCAGTFAGGGNPLKGEKGKRKTTAKWDTKVGTIQTICKKNT